jgi:NhaP-type Na+/H+ or K+/H+ antiporter
LHWAERKKTIEQQSFLGYTLALSITVLGAAKLMGTDGVLAVFISGLAFDSVIEGQERLEEENVQEAINRFFTLPIFLLLGLLIPWQQWWALGWQGVFLVIGILLLRRPPVVLLLKNAIKPLRNARDPWFAASYMGWFGPIGVAAVYYAGYAMKYTQVENIWAVCSLVICASIVVHGLSASPLTRLYGTLEKTNH